MERDRDRGYSGEARGERDWTERAGSERRSWLDDEGGEQRRRLDDDRYSGRDFYEQADRGGQAGGSGGYGGQGRRGFSRREETGYGPGDYGAGGIGMGAGMGMGRGMGMLDYPYGPERDYGYVDRNSGDRGEGRTGRRDFVDRAGDEVASWFGNDDAARRRERDAGHRGRGPKNYARSDERIREDVSDRLMDDPHLDASDIEVSVSGGEVTLDGTVTERFAKRHAEDISESASGVKHVQNNLRVRDRQSGTSSTDTASGATDTGLLNR
ncbi:BON domain-containing protein [Paracoccus beibuensis]|uniref:BON domain-containing protein n=1 Tax=Paracoccus beibuensis TaxID=547602 RepID=UPI00224071D1|nr:BON domain-containing protein [Paracoccus beibuensis]